MDLDTRTYNGMIVTGYRIVTEKTVRIHQIPRPNNNVVVIIIVN